MIFKANNEAHKCNACGMQWAGSDIYCPKCGSPTQQMRKIHLLEILFWAAAVLVLSIWLIMSGRK